MSTRSFECQIARGQISRYLAGDSFSSEALSQLEAHVSGCPDCKHYLGERKSALQSMLGKPQIPAEPEHAPAPEAIATPQNRPVEPKAATSVPSMLRAPGLAQMLLSLFGKKGDRGVSSPSQPAAWRSVAYSVALAMVLGTMSLASRNMDRLFGPKASEAVASKSEEAAKPEGEQTNADKKISKPKAKHPAMKAISPIEAPTDGQSDAAKAARAARNAMLASRAKLKVANRKPAAQGLQDGYQAEPAPKLHVPGSSTVTPKSGAQPAARVAKHPAPAKVASAKPRPAKMLQVVARPRRRATPHVVRIVKKRPVHKTARKQPTSEIRVYAPDSKT